MWAGKSVQNQRFPFSYEADLTLILSEAAFSGGTGWPTSSRRQIYEPVSKRAGISSARLSSRGDALKNLWSICEETGYEGGDSALSAPGGAFLASAHSKTWTLLGGSSGSSNSTVGSLFIRPAMPSFGSLLGLLLTTWQAAASKKTSRRSSRKLALALATTILSPVSVFAAPLSVAEFGQLALRCGPSVAPSTLASLAQTESGFQPLTVNDNTTGTSGVPATREIAIQIASKLLEAGHSLDIGIMQINSSNFKKLGLQLDAAFDPCQSIKAAAIILAGNYAGAESHDGQQAALRVAISKYNTGDAQRGFENGYVHKVEVAARRVVPALDVGISPAAIDSQPTPVAVAVPSDPNAPPSWDVWSSFDYDTMHHQESHAPIAAATEHGSAVLADAGTGPTAAVTVPGPSSGR